MPVDLPQIATLIPQIPLPEVKDVISKAALIKAYTPQQQAIEAAEQIDFARLVDARTRPAPRAGKAPIENNPYSAAELKKWARKYGVQAAGLSKSQLVIALKEKLGRN
jgi:hypothetical protein